MEALFEVCSDELRINVLRTFFFFFLFFFFTVWIIH